MTIIAVFEDKVNGRYWIGSDSMAISGETMTECGSKLIKKNNYYIGFSESFRAADILREEKTIPNKINSISDVKKLRDNLQTALINQAGASSSSLGATELLGHPFSLLIISKIGMFYIGGDYQLQKIKDGYEAIGSGQEFAFGALYTSKQYTANGKDAVTDAVKSAIKHCSSCGGKVYYKSIEK